MSTVNNKVTTTTTLKTEDEEIDQEVGSRDSLNERFVPMNRQTVTWKGYRKI